MRTGIKTLARKTTGKLTRSPLLLYQKQPAKFPQQGAGNLRIRARIQAVVKEIQEYNLDKSIGGFHSKPHEMTVEVIERLVNLNPNNLGNWSLVEQKNVNGTRLIERELIQMMVDLYGGKWSQWEGYLTSGASESNLYSGWMGRKYLERFTKRQNICLIKTSLTHYSIGKTSDIIGIPEFITALHPKAWNMDVTAAEQLITRLHKKGFRGFLVPLTLGYTQTGTSDDLQTIIKRLKKLGRKLEVKFFFWADAALNGLVLPFNSPRFRPLSLPSLQSFLVDFHKFGLTPIPSGVVLYRRPLRKLIEKRIPYLDEKDNTVAGSRSGISSVTCWVIIQTFGRKGLREIVSSSMNKKKTFENSLKSITPKIEVITDEHAVHLGLIMRKKYSLPDKLAKEYGLRVDKIKIRFTGNKDRTVNLCRMIFMPHITPATVRGITKDFLRSFST